jgi:hypothetical protein
LIDIVEVPDPGAGSELGLKDTVTPEGCPEADNVTALLNPPSTVLVMVEVPVPPSATVTVVGDADRQKSSANN